MLPLNPYLAAFFKSTLPAQCVPVHHHVLLVPLTEVLLTAPEADTSPSPSELIASDEFLASHVLRIPNAAGPGDSSSKESSHNLREAKTKGRHYSTINGRTIIIKDNFVFTNKGFKTTAQAQLTADITWYPDTIEPREWLIYFISRPLVGSWADVKWDPAVPSPASSGIITKSTRPAASQFAASSPSSKESNDSSRPKEKMFDITSFHSLLRHFPSIARQMHPGLDRLFREFTIEMGKRSVLHTQAAPYPLTDGPISATTSPRATANSANMAVSSYSTSSSDLANGKSLSPAMTLRTADNSPRVPAGLPPLPVLAATSTAASATASTWIGSAPSLPVTEDFYAEDDEDMLRASLESAVTATIQLFQGVDKQQVTLLSTTTELTGPEVEMFIERYVSENVHHLIFPRLVALKRQADADLEIKIKRMEFIDISQMGIPLAGGSRSKHSLAMQLGLAVEEFRKLSNAMSPQELMDLLLSTIKKVTQLTKVAVSSDHVTHARQASTESSEQERGHEPGLDLGQEGSGEGTREGEKSVLTVNADTLVSLLLFVVIRAQVRGLQARLCYMRNFVFVQDVDHGEMGYALSTFEAVLAYLALDSAGLRRASRCNKALWDAASSGNLSGLRAIFEPGTTGTTEMGSRIEDTVEQDEDGKNVEDDADDNGNVDGDVPGVGQGSSGAMTVFRRKSSAASYVSLTMAERFSNGGSGLGHVFPFSHVNGHMTTAEGRYSDASLSAGPLAVSRRVKMAALDARSMSSESDRSLRSRTMSVASICSGLEADVSIARLSLTCNAAGESVLMMAVQGGHTAAVQYLLSLGEYYPHETVLDDSNEEGTTLLSAATQLAQDDMIGVLLAFVLSREAEMGGDEALRRYLSAQDIWGRSFGHYLFHAPFLMNRVARWVAWRQRDKNGQTPLFALCRSYDHDNYCHMVMSGLDLAAATCRPSLWQGSELTRGKHRRQQSGIDCDWGARLLVDDHVDGKGNTLLHVVNDARLAQHILSDCDVDVNATNEKGLTALMVASKYGRYEMVRSLYADRRTDQAARETRGLTAVELAKDDDVRNRMDDLALFATRPGPDGRITAVVRAMLVEDATVRLVVKTAAPTAESGGASRGASGGGGGGGSGSGLSPASAPAQRGTTWTVTTSRRSVADMERLAELLALEHPASWVPAAPASSSGSGRGAFQIASRPSRAVLRDLQSKANWFLRLLAAHPTFGAHEAVWEFLLVPELRPAAMEQRSRLKAAARADSVREELQPVTDVAEVERFVEYARDAVRAVGYSTRGVARRVNAVGIVGMGIIDVDLHDASALFGRALATCHGLPMAYVFGFGIYVRALQPSQASATESFHGALLAAQSTTQALLAALAKTASLAGQVGTARKAAEREREREERGAAGGGIGIVSRWPLGGILDEARNRLGEEREARGRQTRVRADELGRELRHHQQVVAGELAGWQDLHARMGRDAIAEFARASLVAERSRLDGVVRALRRVTEGMP